MAIHLWCWDASDGADYYTLYKADAHCGPWVEAAPDVYDICALVDDPDPAPGEVRYYVVTASNEHGECSKEHLEVCPA